MPRPVKSMRASPQPIVLDRRRCAVAVALSPRVRFRFGRELQDAFLFVESVAGCDMGCNLAAAYDRRARRGAALTAERPGRGRALGLFQLAARRGRRAVPAERWLTSCGRPTLRPPAQNSDRMAMDLDNAIDRKLRRRRSVLRRRIFAALARLLRQGKTDIQGNYALDHLVAFLRSGAPTFATDLARGSRGAPLREATILCRARCVIGTRPWSCGLAHVHRGADGGLTSRVTRARVHCARTLADTRHADTRFEHGLGGAQITLAEHSPTRRGAARREGGADRAFACRA